MNKPVSKADFPVFDRYPSLAYLDNAATTQKPRQVLEAVDRYYREENANPLRGLYGLSVAATEAYENAREKVRAFIGAKSTKEIIFTRNATESLNLAAHSLGKAFVSEGDEVLVAVSEHHSDMLPWQGLAEERGAKISYLECTPEGEYTVSALEEALTPHTKIFAIAQISNVFGRVNPIKEMAEVCRRNGTLLICDGAQSVPHIAVDVHELGADILVFSGHKMLAPMGIGVLYGRQELLKKMPPFLTGGEMIEAVTLCGATYAELPHKFEAGTVNAGGAVGLGAAIDCINEIGFENIERREAELTALAFEQMKDIPYVRIIGSDKAQEHCGIITFTVEGVHPHDIAALMDTDGVAVRAGHHCAQPLHHFIGIPSTARMSLAFYNDEQDVEKFITSLKGLRRKMCYGE